ESANVVVEKITLMQFHRRMGHISPDLARKLIDKGFVMGIQLDETSFDKPTFCEACIYGKATRKPISKVREGERATKIGGD
ncbi:hypothetical protein F5146DRAFT_874533, partial [Armillaria mellea]